MLDGGAGNDHLFGGSRSTPQGQRSGCDNDTLRGAGDDDVLDGGRGRDLLDGGAGTNDLTADLGRDTIVPGTGINRIQQIRKTDRGCGGVIRSAGGVRTPLRGRFLMDLIRDMRRATDHRSPLGSQNSDHQTGRRPAAPPTVIASHEDEGGRRANLALTTTTSESAVPSAQTLIYTFTVTNAGPNRANHVVIYDTFAENVAVTSLAATKANGDPTSCELEITNDMVCPLGRIRDNPNTEATITAEVVVDAPPGNVNNNGVITSPTRDPVGTDNAQIVTNQVTSALENVSVTATTPVATENGTVHGRFTFSRDVAPNSLAVSFAVSGTAEAGDYGSIGNSVTIPANQCCISIDVVANEDGDADAEVVIVAVQNGNGYVFSSPSQASVSINDNDAPKPVVTIAPSADASAFEAGLDPGRLTVTRTGSTSAALAVSYTVRTGGFFDAKPDSDYNPLSGNVTIPTGSTTVNITVTPRDDWDYETLEYVTVDLQYGTAYDLGSTITADVTITSDDAAPDIVTITAPDPDAAEPGTDIGTFMVSRTDAGPALPVSFTTNAPPATRGTDYELVEASGNTVTIPANALSQIITVQPNNDTLVEGDEPVVVTLVDGPNYDLGTPSTATATVTIHDNDCTPLRITKITRTGGPQIWQGDTITYTASLGRAIPENVNGYFTWEYRETVFVGQRRHYGPWTSAIGTKSLNSFTVNESVARVGQYRVTVISCATVSLAQQSVTVQAPPVVNMTAYRPQTEPFQWWIHPVPEDEELSPGAGIRINGDYDNRGNSPVIPPLTPPPPPTRDRDLNNVGGENDLIAVDLAMTPANPPRGVDYVLVRQNSSIRVWTSAQKGTQLIPGANTVESPYPIGPRRVWVEWPGPGQGAAWLELRSVDLTTRQVLSSDRILFYSFGSIVVALGGENQGPCDATVGCDPNFGTFEIGTQLYDSGYDVHMYDEDVVQPENCGYSHCTGTGEAYNEAVSAIANREVSVVAIFGHSHGGGATRDLAAALVCTTCAPPINGRFTIRYTAYMDAIENEGTTDSDPEARRPPGTQFHANYYQLIGGFAGVHGVSIPGSEIDIDVNVQWPGHNLVHGDVDDWVPVQEQIIETIFSRVPR